MIVTDTNPFRAKSAKSISEFSKGAKGSLLVRGADRKRQTHAHTHRHREAGGEDGGMQTSGQRGQGGGGVESGRAQNRQTERKRMGSKQTDHDKDFTNPAIGNINCREKLWR